MGSVNSVVDLYGKGKEGALGYPSGVFQVGEHETLLPLGVGKQRRK